MPAGGRPTVRSRRLGAALRKHRQAAKFDQPQAHASSGASCEAARKNKVTSEVIGPYQKSPYSLQEGDCVEIALTADGGRAVRDSKDLGRPPLHFAGAGWQGFLLGIKHGTFDA